jgi:hypothetical protein
MGRGLGKMWTGSATRNMDGVKRRCDMMNVRPDNMIDVSHETGLRGILLQSRCFETTCVLRYYESLILAETRAALRSAVVQNLDNNDQRFKVKLTGTNREPRVALCQVSVVYLHPSNNNNALRNRKLLTSCSLGVGSFFYLSPNQPPPRGYDQRPQHRHPLPAISHAAGVVVCLQRQYRFATGRQSL